MIQTPMNQKSENQEFIVIGSGIIGMSCALALQKEGFQVNVVDREPPGSSCSFGNAGAISPSSALPNSLPGVMSKVPGWLLREDGPLFIQWQYFPKLFPWLLRFLQSANWEKVDETTSSLLNLHASCFRLYQNLAKEIESEDLIVESPVIHLYTNEEDFQHSLGYWNILKYKGVEYEELRKDQVREMEPNLSQDYGFGVLFRDSGFSSNPFRLVGKISERFQNDGGRLTTGSVQSIKTQGDGKIVLKMEGQEIQSDQVLVAAGAWSHQLASQLGVRIPLETERGYHVTLNSTEGGPTNIVMESKHKFMATPMEMGVRFAGTAEFAGLNSPANEARAKTLLKLGKMMYPNLEKGESSKWMGHRPSLPDSRPVIDFCPGNKKIIFAFGHGHRGLIGAPMTAQLVAEMASGRQTSIDISAFNTSRF